MSITVHRLVRACRSWPVAARAMFVVLLAAVMAVGTLVVAAPHAYAAFTEARAGLPMGPDIPSSLVATASNVVVGAHRSTNAGGTWSTDATLTSMQESGTWLAAYNGKMYGISGSNQAVVYDVGAGTPATYTLGTGSWSQMNGTWALAMNPASATAYNYGTGHVTTAIPPAGSFVSDSLSVVLGPSGVLVWHATTIDATTNVKHSVFAVAASPSVAPSAWVTIDGVKGWTIDSTQLVYAFDSPAGLPPTGLQLCVRPLATLGSPGCAVPAASVPTPYAADVTVVGGRTFIGAHYDTGVTNWYVTNGLVMDPIHLPAGSSIDAPFLGDAWYVVARDADSVPSFTKVNLDGTLSAGFSNPSQSMSSVTGLAVAPGRVVGSDTRDASSLTNPAWSRTVSGTTFGAETTLPKRASGLAASAGRTAVSGRDGLSLLDRGTVKYTFADAHLGQLSGPYVTQPMLDAKFEPYVLVSKVDGTKVETFPTWSGVLFGSLYLSFAPSTNPVGSTSVTVTDLTSGAKTPRTLPDSAGCTGWVAWNDLVAATCDSGHAIRAYSLKTSLLVASTFSTEAWLSVKELGDGYAVIYGSNGYQLWNLSTDSSTLLVDCLSRTVSDGVGHVACSSNSELIWRDYSSLSTSAGRVLGWSAKGIFAANATAWTPEIDVTKPYSAGVLRISRQGTPIVKDLPVPASADGSLRGVSWDGTNTAGAVTPAGTYTATLVVSGADGSGPVRAVDGGEPTFMVTRTMPGAFTALSPSRLLDTRDGTGVATAGAVGAGGVLDLQVTGRGGVPSSDVGAVILNVTAVTPAGSGFLTVYPTGGAVPNASNLNFIAGQVVPNLVVAKVGTGGKVSIKNSSPGAIHVVADVAGYFAAGTVTDPGGLAAIAPSRLLDTRTTGVVQANGTVKVQAAGRGEVPQPGIGAVVVNITAVTPTGSGFLTAYPTGGAVPNASNVNFTAGQVVPNLAFVKLAADGSFTVKNSSPGATHVVVDVAAYVLFGDPTGPGMFVPLTPTRVLDTRPVYGGAGAVGANAVKVLTMTGAGSVPATGVSGVVLNVTALSSAAGFLTVYPADVLAPNASNVNFTAGQVVPNLVAVKTSATGQVAIRNTSPGPTNVIADVAGYFTG